MINLKEELPVHMQQTTKLGQKISITGKWVTTKKSGLFRKSAESKELLNEWQAIHQAAKNHKGMLSTEIKHAGGGQGTAPSPAKVQESFGCIFLIKDFLGRTAWNQYFSCLFLLVQPFSIRHEFNENIVKMNASNFTV
ncbi:MAG: hypothetical protein ACJAZ2_000779 [Glaciecola sp.]|jgi:hypothetical protein